MAIVNFPARPVREAPPDKLVASGLSALAVGLSVLHPEANSFTCVAGAILINDKLKELGFEVVRVIDMPAAPLS